MPDPIRPSQPTGKPAAKPAQQATTRPSAPTMESDSFLTSPPTPTQLEGLRKAIAALDTLPKVPSGVEEKRAWLTAHQPLIEAARKAVSGLGSVEFFHQAVPKAEVEAAAAKLHRVLERVRETEEEAGLRQPEAPSSPFRPLWGFTNATKGLMSNPLGAVLGAVLIVPAVLIDTMDLATRPLQALAYPFIWGKYQVDQAQYKAAKDR